MEKDVIYHPSFNGRVSWFKKRDSVSSIHESELEIAIYSEDYQTLKIAFKDDKNINALHLLGGDKEMLLRWSGKSYVGGSRSVACELTIKAPNISYLRGTWLLIKNDPNHSNKGETFVVKIQLRPLNLNLCD